METEARADQSKQWENLSLKSAKKLDENRVVMEAKDVVELSPPSTVPANGGASVGPITPDSNRESGDFPLEFTSPLTLVSSTPKSVGFDSNWNNEPYTSNEDSPRTPKDGVFDPFAPGPDKLMLAPHCRKCLKESQSYVARRLNFSSSGKFVGDGKCERDSETISDEDMLLETVYGCLLEAIFSKQTETLFPEISPLDPSPDGFKTPTSEPRLNGIADTCPDAPIKSTNKFRNFDHGLCRKLEF